MFETQTIQINDSKKALDDLRDWAIDLGPCPACKARKGDPCFKFSYKKNSDVLDTYGTEYVHADRLSVFQED